MVGGCVRRRLKEMLKLRLGLLRKEGSGERISSHVGAGVEEEIHLKFPQRGAMISTSTRPPRIFRR
jgi:hypothetical protein